MGFLWASRDLKQLNITTSAQCYSEQQLFFKQVNHFSKMFLGVCA